MALIKVKINTGAITEKVVWNHESELMLLSITDHEVDGAANSHITAYLSAILEMPKSKINIIKGFDSAYKIIEIGNELSYISKKILDLNNH